jgi:hypothetical protein
MREQPHTQVLQRTLPDPPDEVGLRVGGQGIDERREDERADDQVERGDVVALDPVVDGQLGQRRRRQRSARRGDQRDHHRQHAPAVRGQQLGQPTQLARAAGAASCR